MRIYSEHRASAITYAIDCVETFLADDPTMSGTAVLDELRRMRALLDDRVDIVRHCGTPIKRDYPQSEWRHTDISGSRGCRAASFDPDAAPDESAWNDSLKRSMKAEPAKGSELS
ncbi:MULTISPECIES: hypothetical protein [Rhodococcus]|uniref:Uncharacterized protein n=1 Tax=Rhodococcus opacus RKJ300 = JCM 13270 TaxID=1165867 RepID=I0WUE3_RHOOP|nr:MULTISPECIES: hypothetical protein [Rhodococcus]EID80009.1 hypothetical protein W59_10449 [Rhodococcus opacus RKJ300 = JCM 13270]KAF0965581.1 hypothetical protein MLGJGCBP_01279 [Rhodococcus sp. T7]QQZ18181.1 hypothetical protein GO592_38550 [Rhodococcus sp. 21391]UOT08096.1 hypothetical protein MPY17_37640 [Rhodococcus opacus]